MGWLRRTRVAHDGQRRRAGQLSAAACCMAESLEPRQLLASAAAVVTSTVADNRGYVQIRFNKALQASTVSKSTARVFTAGVDGQLGTPDDVATAATVSYNKSKKTIVLKANVAADVAYRVKLYSSKIKDSNGLRIDGEFKTGGKSGNGTPGGDYQFRVKRDTGANPVVRFTTNLGDIDVRLFRGSSVFSTRATPINVAAFTQAVNAADYDNAFVHRLVKGVLAQWGGLKLTSTGQVDLVPDLEPTDTITGEPGNSNLRGTLGYYLNGGPDTADNELYFNVKNNTSSANGGLNLDDASSGSGPFTVLGRITNSKGLAVLDAINALHRLDLSGPLQGTGSSANNVPVRSSVTVTGETPTKGGSSTKTLNTFKDLVVFSRVAVLGKVVAA
jgi:cyclophilin family peptidyl-prolyl cis-trans isomerase